MQFFASISKQILSVGPLMFMALVMGVLALVGLLLQKKSFSDVIKGTFKTIIGVVILLKGLDVINGALTPLSTIFGKLFTVQGNAMPDFGKFLGEQGGTIGAVLIVGFVINLLLARFTKYKFIFLTGHILFWNAFMFAGVFMDAGGLTGWPLILVAGLFLGLYNTFIPALTYPFVNQLVGGKAEFTIGHSTAGISIIGAYLGKWFGNKARSTEELVLPRSLDFLRDVSLASGIIIFVIYLIAAPVAGLPFVAEKLSGGQNWVLWALLNGVTFAAGMTVLLTGVRMMLGEILPAFKGIATKIVPNAIPALDCPLIFPYAPNAVLIGFIAALVTSAVTIVLFGLGGFSYVLLPLVVACFFDVGPAAVLANASGGLRGAVIAGAAGGVLLIVFQAFSLPFVANTVGGFINAFGGNDFSLIAIVGGLVGKLVNLFM